MCAVAKNLPAGHKTSFRYSENRAHLPKGYRRHQRRSLLYPSAQNLCKYKLLGLIRILYLRFLLPLITIIEPLIAAKFYYIRGNYLKPYITINMRHLITFLLFTIHISIFAQSNYRPGYVVQSNGDTLKGFINYREWGK